MEGSIGRLEMRVGVLVVAGLMMTVILILISDRVSFSGSYKITVYMDDAAGLHPGSPVRLDGLTIGSVNRIQSFQDPKGRGSIRADVTIDRQFTIDKDASLHRQTEGFFGDGILAFSNPKEASGSYIPTNGSAELVASGTFFDEASARIGTIVDGVAEVLGKENRQNIGRIIAGSAELVDEGTLLVKDLRARSNEIASLARRAETMIDRVDKESTGLLTKAGDDLDELKATLVTIKTQVKELGTAGTELAKVGNAALLKADSLLSRGDKLMATSSADLQAASANFKGLAANLRIISEDIRKGRGILGQLIANSSMAKDINDTLIAAEQLAERIAERPEILIWGTPDKERDLARDLRDKRKLRRAFLEGFDSNPPIKLDSRPDNHPVSDWRHPDP